MADASRKNQHSAPAYRQSRPCTSPLPNLAFVTYFSQTACPDGSLARVRLTRDTASSTMFKSMADAMTSSTQAIQTKRTSFSSIPRPSLDRYRLITKIPPSLINDEQASMKQQRFNTQNDQFVQVKHLRTSVIPFPGPSQECLSPANDRETTHAECNTRRKGILVESFTSVNLVSSLPKTDTLKSRPHLPRSATETDLLRESKHDSPRSQHNSKATGDAGIDICTDRGVALDDPHTLSVSRVSTANLKRLQDGTSDQDDRHIRAEEEPDPRLVYRSEPIQYWLGRYIACRDRLNNVQCESDKHRSFSNTSKASIDSDSSDARLRHRLLAQLVTVCQTEAALSGFKRFEYYINHPPAPACGNNLKKLSSASRNFSGNPSTRQKNVSAPAPAHPKTRKMSRSISSGIFQEKLPAPEVTGQRDSPTATRCARPASPRLAEDLQYSRSFIPPTGSRQRTISWRSADPDRRISPPRASLVPYTKSYVELSQDDRRSQTLATKGPFQTHDYQEEVHEALQRTRNAQNSLGASDLVQSESLRSILSGTSASSYASFVTATTSEHPQPDVVAVVGRHSEHYVNSSIARESTHRFRKSESMKKLVDAGIREIKKIGHRVSHQSGYDSDN